MVAVAISLILILLLENCVYLSVCVLFGEYFSDSGVAVASDNGQSLMLLCVQRGVNTIRKVLDK